MAVKSKIKLFTKYDRIPIIMGIKVEYLNKINSNWSMDNGFKIKPHRDLKFRK